MYPASIWLHIHNIFRTHNNGHNSNIPALSAVTAQKRAIYSIKN